MSRLPLVAGALLTAVGLLGAGLRVLALETGELDHASSWAPLAPTPSAEPGSPPEPRVELARVELDRGEEVAFELCSSDALEPTLWAGTIDLVLWHPESGGLALRVPLDEELLARARRSRAGSCVVFGHAPELAEGGAFVLEAVWPDRELPEAVRSVPVRARILAFRNLAQADRWLVLAVLAGSLLVVLGATRWPRTRLAERAGDVADDAGGRSSSSAPRGLLAVAAGICGLVAAGLLLGLLPFGGATVGLARGLVLAGVQLALAVALVGSGGPGGRRAGLGLVRPRRAVWLLWLAPVVGVLLWLVGRVLLRVVPSTAEAPVEALVSWPSGQLAVSLVGAFVPLAEELFFRGLVYGRLEARLGRALAFAATVALFALAHLPQTWGAWGGLAAILATGAGLTALRAWTGSTVAPAVAHLGHNGAISVLAALLRG